LAVGLLELVEGARRFVERRSFRPDDRPVAHVRWIAYDRETPLELRWRSPSGKEYPEGFTVMPETAFAHSAFPGPIPLQQGRWTLSIREPGGGPVLLSGFFEVGAGNALDSAAP
jgi:hypothetical protein